MDKTRLPLFYTLLLAEGIWFSCAPLYSAPSPFTIQLPAYSTDFSDLDVRDGYNRKITSVTKQNELQRLFEKNLSGLILGNMLPSKRAAQFVLGQVWQNAFGWLQKLALKTAASIIAWFSKKKWVHNFSSIKMDVISSVESRWRCDDARTNFHSLIPALLSSITLLR